MTTGSLHVSDVAVVDMGLDGRIAGWNMAAHRMFGWSPANAIGRPIDDVFSCDAETLGSLRDDAARGESTSCVSWATTPLGVRTRVRLNAVPAPDAMRAPLRLLVTAELTGDDASIRLAAIVESSDDAILSKDLSGIVTTWNQAAERTFGYTAAEMVGHTVRLLVPDDRQAEEDATLETIRGGDQVDHFQTVRRHKNGSLIDVSLTVSPIRDPFGTVVGASTIARDITQLKAAEDARFQLLEESAAVTATLNKVGASVASDLDLTSMVQAVTDAATALTGADVGAFFYNVLDDAGESYKLYTISGVPRDAFAQFPMPRNTRLFDATFAGTGVVRSPDITQDPRYGQSAPHFGMPRGHLPVRSYLAVPVKGRRGGVIGGLFFGHAEVDRFTERHEQLAVGIALWASVALENARLYQAAQEASRLKDDFLANLSHELRTPLNAILGYARIVRSGLIAADKRDKAIETIERNANALAQIIEDVLDVSRIIAGKMRLDVRTVDVPDVVRAAVDAVTPAADARGIRIECVLDPGAMPISGDPDRLQQVLWNLLTNAVKFTNRDGRVQVRLALADSHVIIEVSDTGIGIASEFLPHLFERFRQVETGTTKQRGGLGLGLAIARQIVEMHGGTIAAASPGPGFGSTFTVSLPLMIVHPLAAPPRVHPRVAAEPRPGVSPDLHGVHVLAVDDDRDALALVSEVLESAGARVTTAYSAAQVLTLIDAEPPDVLVSDLGMPQMDGFELIDLLRRHDNPRVRATPAAALTAYARSEDRVKALSAGFQMHLAKPIEPAELVITVAALVQRIPA